MPKVTIELQDLERGTTVNVLFDPPLPKNEDDRLTAAQILGLCLVEELTVRLKESQTVLLSFAEDDNVTSQNATGH